MTRVFTGGAPNLQWHKVREVHEVHEAHKVEGGGLYMVTSDGIWVAMGGIGWHRVIYGAECAEGKLYRL